MTNNPNYVNTPYESSGYIFNIGRNYDEQNTVKQLIQERRRHCDRIGNDIKLTLEINELGVKYLFQENPIE